MKKIILLSMLIWGGLMVAQKQAKIIIDSQGDIHPWNNLNVNNSNETFQFAIVTDRTGGVRPGVFPVAVDKLNLLQPEFVMSVGDLITGYTEDRDQINKEWDEFNGFISKLTMPFFYLPGNHDYINDVMAEEWKKRFGKDYYHFVYKDVLFLCLNTEELKRGAGRGAIDQPQYDYIKKTLAKNSKVKWTLVFMHQPLWDQEDNGMWEEVETLLKDRKHTVYVGHRHRYVKYERNNSNYFILATTGGGSGLRGPAFGEFDHVVWITMTEEGPIMANLLLDGIWDENVQTEEGLKRMRGLTSAKLMQIELPVADQLDEEDGVAEPVFEEGGIGFTFTNPADIPLFVEVELETHKDIWVASAPLEIEIGPNSVEKVAIPLASDEQKFLSEMDPFEAEVTYTYKPEGAPELEWEKEFKLQPMAQLPIQYSGKPIKVDGKLSDWPDLRFAEINPIAVSSPFAHTGDKDGSFSFDIAYHGDYVYMAMEVVDDDMVIKENGDISTQDGAFFLLDARSMADMMTGEGGRPFRDWPLLGICPTKDGSTSLFQEAYLPKGVEVATTQTDWGYIVEAAVPIDYIKSKQGDNWKHLRFNCGVHDVDKNGDHDSQLFWKPDWRFEKNIIGSGMFKKQ
ncbi:MAG: metallophosphoesterase [Bacteroidota bacterium]